MYILINKYNFAKFTQRLFAGIYARMSMSVKNGEKSMQEFSKYKMITVGIVLMFIFAVAAIYSNTKEAAEKKLNEKPAIEQSQGEIEQGTAINTIGDFATQNTNNDNNIETDNQILQITERLDELEKKVFTQENNENLGMRCNIKGSYHLRL